ncbi:MAG: hypothetical protein SV760_10135, partial [Halobacteria archaeon]|nr:hypothetical protein [Halobacteria archaeon]
MDIGEVVKNGFNRTVQRTGLILVAVYAVINLLTSIFTFDVTSLVPKSQLPFGSGTSSGFGPGATQVATTPGFSIELSLPLLLAINVVGWIVGLAFTVVATRVLVSDHTDSIPEAFYKERMVSAVGNIILAGVAVALIFVGSALVFTEVPSYISSTFAILGFLAWIVFAVLLLV